MRSPSLHIQHFDVRYRVRASSSTPAAAIQGRLDRIARDLLPGAWDSGPGPGDWGETAHLFIERLELNLTLDLAADNQALAAIWLRALRREIGRTAIGGGAKVLSFPDRAHYLAEFLADLLKGRAGDAWYYREFQPLAPRSPGQASTLALTEDGDTGRDALLILARRGDLDLLLGVLSDAEVERVVAGCLLPEGPRLSFPALVPPWVEALGPLMREFSWTGVLSRDLVRLYLTLLRQHPELGPDVNLARFLRDLLELRQEMANHPAGLGLMAVTRQKDSGREPIRPGPGRAQPMLELLRQGLGEAQSAAWVEDLLVHPEAGAGRRISTRFAGVFLLVPALLKMGLPALLSQSPDAEPQGADKSGLLRFIVALQCLGPGNAKAARRDAGVARFAGLPAAPGWGQLRRYLRGLSPELPADLDQPLGEPPGGGVPAPGPEDAARLLPDLQGLDRGLTRVSGALLRQFAAGLGAFAPSSDAYLRRNFLESRAEVEIAPGRLAVRFLTCPLQMVLRLAGFEASTWTVPWLEDRRLEFYFD